MPRTMCRWTIVCCLLAGAACQGKPGGTPTAAPIDPAAVLATVDGKPITGADLLGAIDYQAKKNTLEALIEQRLLNGAAATAGMSVEQYLKKNVEEKVAAPAEAEMKQLYEQNKARMGNKSYEETKADITRYLTQRNTQQVEGKLMAELRAAAKVQVLLEPDRVKVEGGKNPSRGPKGAPIQIVEWTDYQCPFCARSRSTLNQIFETYGEKVYYVIRDFPLDFHKQSAKAHEAAHCAGDQEKYWEMNQKLFANQQAIDVPNLKEYAKELKLDAGKFDDCLAGGKHEKKVRENEAAGKAAGVNGTPAFFVNGIPLSGARPFSEFKELIDRELAKTGG